MISLTIGQKINGWTYIGKASDSRPEYGLFRCDCGNVKNVFIQGVVHGQSKHCKICGRYKYNLSKEDYKAIYTARIRAMNRCYNPKNPSYYNYGKRGITVCDEWRKNPSSFVEWGVKNGWKRGLTLDRIDNNLGYSPENCRWATPKTQSNNRLVCIYYEHDGMRKTLAEWSEYYNMPKYIAYNRYRRGEREFDTIFSTINRRTGGVLHN